MRTRSATSSSVREEARDYGVVDEVVASRVLVGVPSPIELRPQEAETTRV